MRNNNVRISRNLVGMAIVLAAVVGLAAIISNAAKLKLSPVVPLRSAHYKSPSN